MITPDEIENSLIPVPYGAVVGVELDGEAVLYHEEAKTVHVLNPTATIIWNCLDGRIGLERLCLDLGEAFEVPVERLRSDVVNAVRELGRQGLLQGVQPDTEAVAASTLAARQGPRPPFDTLESTSD